MCKVGDQTMGPIELWDLLPTSRPPPPHHHHTSSLFFMSRGHPLTSLLRDGADCLVKSVEGSWKTSRLHRIRKATWASMHTEQ